MHIKIKPPKGKEFDGGSAQDYDLVVGENIR